MQKRTALLATTAFAALAFAAPAHAAGTWYLSVTGGANWLEDDNFFSSIPAVTDTLTVASDGDAGWLVAGAVGYSLAQVTPGLRAEVEVAYRDNQVDGVFSSSDGGAATTGTLDYDHSALSVMANVWYDFDVGGIRPYIGGGLGWADVEADGTYLTALLVATPFSVSDSGFAWQAGAGVNFQVAPSMQLGVGYRYFSGPEVRLLPPIATNTASGELDYDNHAATVTLTFGM